MNKKDIEEMLFPYDAVRNIQKDMVRDVKKAVDERKHIIVHAPTGLGKTAAALGPCLSYALKSNKRVFFLTSRHTQHIIAIETLRMMKEKYKIELEAADIIGKKWMCMMKNVERLSSGEFSDYCKSVREDNICEAYINTRKKVNELTPKAKNFLEKCKGLRHTEELKNDCEADELCPYEIAVEIAKKAKVIIADYNYVFHPTISKSFFERIGISMEDAILIIDEGHNLAGRLQEMTSDRLNSYIIKQAIKEGKKFGFFELVEAVAQLQDILLEYSKELELDGETEVERDDFIKKVNDVKEYDELTDDCEHYGSIVREEQVKSFIGSIGGFLKAWKGEDDGYARILDLKEYRTGQMVSLYYKCLDPSLLSEKVLDECHSAIMMSGTLTPTEMYSDLLGFPLRTTEKEYESPFAKENKLSMIVPMATTKFTKRSMGEFGKIANIVARIATAVNGNTAAYFPSYHLRDEVALILQGIYSRKMIIEKRGMTKEEKAKMLGEFKSYSNTGALLLGVGSGSFGEGIDLPGELLKCVVVVGLPLKKPSLETKKLIEYYNIKYGRGWDYGYVLPAITKVLQNAGRCIRSETDRGVIVYLDERYAWPSYSRCFPHDSVEVCRDYEKRIAEFFSKK